MESLLVFTGVAFFQILFLTVMGVDQAPFVITDPSGETVALGNRHTLHCLATGTAPIAYQWQINSTNTGNIGTDQGTYSFGAISKDDAGIYRCIAQNSVGSVLSKGAEIHVSYFEDYTGTDEARSVTAGEAIVLTCPTYDSYPNPAIKWRFNELDIIEGQDSDMVVTADGRLVLLASGSADEGRYSCRATNVEYGRSQLSPNIALSIDGSFPTAPFVQPTIVIPPSDTVVRPGQTFVEMDCVVNAHPLDALQISWYKDGTLVTLASGPILQIRNPGQSHAGVYMCEAVLTGSSYDAVNASANLSFFVEPTLTDPPPRSAISPAGSMLTVACRATGVPTPQIKWYRNAVGVGDGGNGRFTVGSDGSLTLTSIQKADGGMFQCQAINEVGEALADTWLQVKEIAPEIAVSPNNTTILEGDSVVLECIATGAPEPVIHWLKDGLLVADNIRSSNERLLLLVGGSLLLSQALKEDSGEYTCIATNTVGTTNATATVTVYQQTIISQKPTSVDTVLGGTSTLTCVVQHDPRVTPAIVWTIDGGVILVDASSRHSLLGSGSLRIAPTIAQDTGLYACAVTSDAGNDSGSANLTVLQAPYKPVNVIAEQSVDQSRAIVVSWMPAFNGNSPLIRYILEQKEDDSSFMEVEATIPPDLTEVTVTGVKPARTYQYRLKAQNSIGVSEVSDPSTAVRLPEEPPDLPPQSLRASATSTSSILVQWQEPPYDSLNGDLQGYTLRWRPTGYTTDFNVHNVTSRLQTSFEINSLVTWTAYAIQAAAYNGAGVGAYSNVVEVRTHEGVPTDPPQEVVIQVVSSTTFRYRFKPPPVYSINGINQGYKLLAWEDRDVANPITVIVPHNPALDRFEGNITTLKKYTRYQAAVLCFTVVGDGPTSAPESLTTLEDVPGPVDNLRLVNIYDTSLEVVWEQPLETNGQLTGYEISWMVENRTSSLRSVDRLAHQTGYTITGLTAQTAYLIQVWAKTSVGDGEKTATFIMSGVPPERPQPPTNLAVSDVRERSVQLHFTPGFDGYAGITLWTVQALVGQSTLWEEIFDHSDPNAREFTVLGLVPYTQYLFRMIAVNVAGASNASAPSRRVQTWQDVPEIFPREIRVRAYNATALRVTWVPLDDGEWNGQPGGYNIYWHETGSQGQERSLDLSRPYDNDYIITGLDAWTSYDVRMEAYNIEFDGPSSNPVTGWTNEAAPSAGPMNIEALPTSEDSIQVTWGDVPRADQNGEILGFKIIFRETGGTLMYMDVPGNGSRLGVLTQLRGYTVYTITVLAYTRAGDGVTGSEVPVRTLEATPSAPVGITFPTVQLDSVVIAWNAPLQPNGPNLQYRVGYRLESAPQSSTVEVGVGSALQRSLSSLQAERVYIFEVTARTSSGWGDKATVRVTTTTDRSTPGAPSVPIIDRIRSRQVRMSWTPGDDGNSPLRYYTVDIRAESGSWVQHSTYIDSSLVSYTVNGLEPYTTYSFRLTVHNDVGRSPDSPASDPARTDQDVPDGAPTITGATPLTVTSLLVAWSPPPEGQWNGPLLGYRIQFTQLPGTSYMEVNTVDAGVTQYQLLDLVRYQNYEVKVAAYNGKGLGPYGAPVTVYIGEAVPSEAPSNVQVLPLGPSLVQISWTPPSLESQNGGLQGYKVVYSERAARQARSTRAEMTKTYPSTATTALLDGLTCFTEYSVEVKGFNAAGDGPATSPVYVTTAEDVPSEVAFLRFHRVRMTSLNVSWGPPPTPCGVVAQYRLFFQPLQPVDGVKTSMMVTLPDDQLFFNATSLGEEVQYEFQVWAETTRSNGPAKKANITTGPQEGGPDSPAHIRIQKNPESVTLSWEQPAYSGDTPLIGYLIESKEKGENSWDLVSEVTDPDKEEYSVPLTRLKTGATYLFRIMAENSVSVSEPVVTEEFVTPDASPEALTNFYEQWWFLVIVALVGIIVIILVGATLCMLGRSRLYVERKVHKRMTPIERVSTEEAGFTSFEMDPASRRSARNGRTHQRGGGYSRTNSYTRPPPRPSPGSIQYSEEEESKHYEDVRRRPVEEPGENSSLTEKADLQSLSESLASESDVDMEVSVRAAEPPSFVNHYASLPGTQSWRRQHPPKTSGPGSNAYSYTDSEPDPVPTVDGRTLYLQNNLATMPAGSRAPVHGFSSFV